MRRFIPFVLVAAGLTVGVGIWLLQAVTRSAASETTTSAESTRTSPRMDDWRSRLFQSVHTVTAGELAAWR